MQPHATFPMLLLLLTCICSNNISHAQNVIEVNEIEGLGLSAIDAENNALINAVRQALGSFVDSKTLVINDELVEDKIIVTSGGFVDSYEVVSKSLLGSGLFQIVINARVSRNKLERKFLQQELSKSIDISNEYAKSWSKLSERKAASNAVNLLLKSIVLSMEPRITYGYDEIEESLNLNLYWARKPGEWASILSSAKQILSKISTGPPINVATPMLRLNTEFAMHRFPHLVSAPPEQRGLNSGIKDSPSFFLATNVSPLLRHPAQHQSEYSWILWIQQSSSDKETRWVGHVLETELSAINALIATRPLIEINLKNDLGNTLVKYSAIARMQLNQQRNAVMPIETGVFALSSDGKRLISDSDSHRPALTSNTLSLEKFWRENQSIDSSKVHVFVPNNPIAFSMKKASAEDSILDRRFLAGRDKETFATFALLHCSGNDSNNKKAIAGLKLRLKMPLAVSKMKELATLSVKLKSTFDEQQEITRLKSYFGNDCEVNWDSDHLTYGLKVTVSDSTQTLNPSKELVNLRELDIDGIHGQECETLKLFSRSTGIESLRFNFREMETKHGFDNRCAEIIASQSALQQLQISGCNLDSESASIFTELKSLDALDLRGSFVGDHALSVLSRIQSLTKLELENIESKQQIAIIARMPNLQRLTVQALPSEDLKSLLADSLPECHILLGAETSEGATSN